MISGGEFKKADFIAGLKKSYCPDDPEKAHCEGKMETYFDKSCGKADADKQADCSAKLETAIKDSYSLTTPAVGFHTDDKYPTLADTILGPATGPGGNRTGGIAGKYAPAKPVEPPPSVVPPPPAPGTPDGTTGWVFRVETLVPITISDPYGVGIGATPVNVDGFTDHRDVFGLPWLRGSVAKIDGLREWGASVAYAYGRPRNDNYTPTDSTGDLLTFSFYGRKNFLGLWKESPDRVAFLKGAFDVYATTGPVLMSGNMVGTQQIVPGTLGLYGISLSAGIQQDAFFGALETSITGGKLDTTLDPAAPSTTYIHLGTQDGNWPVLFVTGGYKF